jgi:hypothetical protein
VLPPSGVPVGSLIAIVLVADATSVGVMVAGWLIGAQAAATRANMIIKP